MGQGIGSCHLNPPPPEATCKVAQHGSQLLGGYPQTKCFITVQSPLFWLLGTGATINSQITFDYAEQG